MLGDIPIDPQALEKASDVYERTSARRIVALENAIRAYLAASALPRVVETAQRLVWRHADGSMRMSLDFEIGREMEAALAALKGGGDA